VVDAWLVAGAAGAGGTIQLQTAGGAAVTDTIAGPAAGIIGRAASINIANDNFAAGATMRINVVGGGTSAGVMFILLQPE